MALGKILREARISRGFTESEVAERIKMNSQMIVDLECENYSRIAAPIYGKGYVRKYAEFLGIDYRPLVEEFTAVFGGGNVEKPTVPLESYDLESGTITKVIPASPSRPTSDIQQPVAAPVVQSSATPEQVVAQSSLPIKEEGQVAPSTSPNVSSDTLFSEFEPQASEPVAGPTENEASNDEVYVPAHLATTPPTATIPPPNTIPDSVAQSRYTFSPEKFTPRTTVFKPEQIPSASAPEPISLSVAPFSYPEPEVTAENDEEEAQETIFVSTDEEDKDSLFASQPHKNNKPILTRYSAQTKDIEPETISDEPKQKSNANPFGGFVKALVGLFSKIGAYFKYIFSSDPEEDITKAYARKQRRLGFIFGVIIVVILIIVFSVGGGSATEPTENEVVEESSSQEEIVNLVENKNPELTVVNTETVEVVQILPTPQGFLD